MHGNRNHTQYEALLACQKIHMDVPEFGGGGYL
jgi:hypothetical protein